MKKMDEIHYVDLKNNRDNIELLAIMNKCNILKNLINIDGVYMKKYLFSIAILFLTADAVANIDDRSGYIIEGKLTKQYSLQELLNINWLPVSLVNELVELNDDVAVSNFSSTITYSAKPVSKMTRGSAPPPFPSIFNEEGDVATYKYVRSENGLIWEYEVTYTLKRDPNGNLVWVAETTRTFKGFDDKYFDIK